MISVTSYGHPLDSSVTSYGHPPKVSVPLIARILKKNLKMGTKKIFFTIFTMLILFLRVFYAIYVKISLHVTVPLRWLRIALFSFHSTLLFGWGCHFWGLGWSSHKFGQHPLRAVTTHRGG